MEAGKHADRNKNRLINRHCMLRENCGDVRTLTHPLDFPICNFGCQIACPTFWLPLAMPKGITTSVTTSHPRMPFWHHEMLAHSLMTMAHGRIVWASCFGHVTVWQTAHQSALIMVSVKTWTIEMVEAASKLDSYSADVTAWFTTRMKNNIDGDNRWKSDCINMITIESIESDVCCNWITFCLNWQLWTWKGFKTQLNNHNDWNWSMSSLLRNRNKLPKETVAQLLQQMQHGMGAMHRMIPNEVAVDQSPKPMDSWLTLVNHSLNWRFLVSRD